MVINDMLFDDDGIQAVIKECQKKNSFSKKKAILENASLWEAGCSNIFGHLKSKFYLAHISDEICLALKYPPSAHFFEGRIIVACHHFSYVVKKHIAPLVFPEYTVTYYHMRSNELCCDHIAVKVGDGPLLKKSIYGMPRIFQNVRSFDENYPITKLSPCNFSTMTFFNGGMIPYREIITNKEKCLVSFSLNLEMPKEYYIANSSSDQIVISIAIWIARENRIVKYSAMMLFLTEYFINVWSKFEDRNQKLFRKEFVRQLNENTFFGVVGSNNISRSISPLFLSDEIRSLFVCTFEDIVERLIRHDFLKCVEQYREKARFQ